MTRFDPNSIQNIRACDWNNMTLLVVLNNKEEEIMMRAFKKEARDNCRQVLDGKVV